MYPIFKRLLRAMCSAAVMFASVAYASIAVAGVELPNGIYHTTQDDIVVKVMGGVVKAQHTWYDGRWHFTRGWNNLLVERSNTTNEVTSIERNSRTYDRVANANQFIFDKRYRFTVTGTEMRWDDRKGGWAVYDTTGKLLRYGDRNNVQVSFQYDAQNRRTGVFDHFGTQVLWYEYEGTTNRLIAVRDNAVIAQARRVQYQYTGDQLTTVIDVLNNPWTYAYTNNKLTRITDPESRITNIDYQTDGAARSITRADGTGVFYDYDYDKTRKEYFTRQRFSSGRVLETWHNAEGEVVRRDINGITVETVLIEGRKYTHTNELGHRTTRDYDEWDNLLKITHPDLSSRTYTYDPNTSNILTETDERGIRTRYVYDTNGNLTQSIEAEGLTEQRIIDYTPDAYGNTLGVRKEADANTEEALTTYTYDNNGNVTTKIVRVGASESHTSNYDTYDRMGNLLEWRDARNNIWRRVYDAKGQLRTVTDPLLHSTNIDYDRANNSTAITNALSHATNYYYDINNRLYQIRDAETNVWSMGYTLKGQLETEQDPENKLIKRTLYDDFGRTQSSEDGVGNTTAYYYGVVRADNVRYEQLQGIDTPTFSQRYRYDYRGRRTHTIDILSTDTQRTTEQRFDASGHLTSVIDAEQKLTQYEYDALGRRDRVINPDTTDVEYIYDNRDNLIRVVNENSIVIRRYAYDQKNRKTQEILPGNETISYYYDANDSLIRRVDAKGQVAIYVYDIANRLEAIRYYPNMLAVTNNDPASKTVTVTFDDANRLTGYNDGTTSATYTYNNMNQKLTETVTLPGGLSVNHAYTYYRNGQVQTHTGPDAITYNYTYDAGNRLSSISLPGEGSIIYNRYKWTVPELITLPGNNTQTTNYDPLMRVQDITVKDAAQNALLGYQYSYDMADNIQSKTTEHGVYAYDYDDRYRLTSADNPTVTDEAYTYDDTSNRLTSLGITGNWVYDNDNKLRSYGNTSMDYDANGSRFTESVSGVVTRRFVYNLENRLSEVRDNNNDLIASYYYDPFGRRMWKEVAGTRIYFAYSGSKLSAELNNAGIVTRSYGYAPKGQGNVSPLFVRTSAGYRYYLNDHLATPQQLIDRNGARIWQGRQQAFGAMQV